MSRSRRWLISFLIFGAFLFVPVMPWYVIAIAGILAAWRTAYYELIFLGFLADLSFSSSSFISFYSVPLPLFFTVSAAIIVFVLQTIKKKVRFYA